MTSLWDGVRSFEGQTLRTVTGPRFDVAEVTDDHVRIVVRSSGQKHRIPRSEFDRAAAMRLALAGGRPSRLRQAGASGFQLAHVAAIINADVQTERPG